MNEQIKQIAERLRGLREVLELTPEEVAASCQMPVENYLEMESGNNLEVGDRIPSFSVVMNDGSLLCFRYVFLSYCSS